LKFKEEDMLSNNLVNLIGLILAIIIVYIYKKDKQNNTHHLIDGLLYLLWALSFTFITLVYSNIDPKHPEAVSAFIPLGMMIAAFIASASIMKNIAETKAHDLAKSEKEKERKRFFTMNVIKTIDQTIQSMQTSKALPLSVSYPAFMANMDTSQKLIDTIFCESILPFLSEDEQSIVSQLYSHFNQYLFLTRIHEPFKDNPADTEAFIQVIEKYMKDFGTYLEKYTTAYKTIKDQQ